MRSASALFASALALGLLVSAGCTNPNDIGVQDYGSVTVHCVRFSDGSPVTGVLVSAAGQALQDHGDGIVMFPKIPVGVELFTASGTGLKGMQTATIQQGANPDVTIQMQPN